MTMATPLSNNDLQILKNGSNIGNSMGTLALSASMTLLVTIVKSILSATAAALALSA